MSYINKNNYNPKTRIPYNKGEYQYIYEIINEPIEDNDEDELNKLLLKKFDLSLNELIQILKKHNPEKLI